MVLCSGCFDGLHAGHIAYLEAAYQLRETGEPMIVAVASDEYIRAFKHREPHWPQDERMRVVQAIRYVSGTVGHGVTGATLAIRNLAPRLFVKGEDWRNERIPGDILSALAESGTRWVYVDSGTFKHSSDALSAHQ